MSKLHVLAGFGRDYTVVVHQATPGGSNSAGIPWSTVIVAANRNTSVMTVGAGYGQILQAEMDSILAGTTIEGVFTFTDDPDWNPATRIDELKAWAEKHVATLMIKLANELKWFGAVIA